MYKILDATNDRDEISSLKENIRKMLSILRYDRYELMALDRIYKYDEGDFIDGIRSMENSLEDNGDNNELPAAYEIYEKSIKSGLQGNDYKATKGYLGRLKKASSFLEQVCVTVDSLSGKVSTEFTASLPTWDMLFKKTKTTEKNKYENQNRIIEKSDVKSEKLTKSQVLDLIQAHELVKDMIEYTRVRLKGVFDFRKVSDLEQQCKKWKESSKSLKSDDVREKIENALDTILRNIGSSNRDEKLHNAKIYVVGVEIKLKRFAREKLEFPFKDIVNELLGLSNEDIGNLGLDKKNLKKLTELRKSAQKQQGQGYNCLNLSNSGDSFEKNNLEENL